MTRLGHKRNDLRRTRKGDESGAVIVEFAVIIPFLAILLVGAIDIGLLTRDHQILQNGAREGARYASLPGNWILLDAAAEGRIEQRVITYLAYEGITVTPADITIEQGSPDCQATYGTSVAECSRVTVVYNKSLFLPGLNLLGVDPVPLEGNAVFRNLF